MGQQFKAGLVLVVLTALLVFLFSIGEPWWHGLVKVAFVFAVGIPIGSLLVWWIKR